MKKTLLFTFLLLCTLSVSAQVTFKPGIRAGANFSKITNTDLDGKTDFYISAFGALKLTRFYTMQPEIGYSRQGGEGNIVTTNYYYTDYNSYETQSVQNVDVELQYITFALINKFTLTNNFNIHVGPTFDIITNSSQYTYNDVDLGVTAGIGYTTPFGLGVEARVKKGFVNVVDNYYYNNQGNDYYDYNDNANNLVFSLGLTYSFNVTGSSK